MVFQLDTSGRVAPFHRYDPRWITEPVGYAWEDLSPFTQGYVQALFAAGIHGEPPQGYTSERPLGFSDLAPETLARIMEDCERFLSDPRTTDRDALGADNGQVFWNLRAAGFGESADFPPLTPYLGDDGKVYLRTQDPTTPASPEGV